MSKNIVIQEGGIGKQLTADKLKTILVGGGTCLWVPEDETQLGTKYVSENGTYKASDDGYYGFSEFTVSGVGTATGKDGDGDQAQTTVDPETGDLVTKKLIESIQITTPPAKTTYQDGETLAFSGLVVHGYSSTGRDMGVIPLNKLSISPTTAAYDAETATQTATSEFCPEGINISGYVYEESESTDIRYTTTISGADAYCTRIANGLLGIIDAARSPGEITTQLNIAYYKETGEIASQSTRTSTIDYSFTYDGKTVYYKNGYGGSKPPIISPSPSDGGSASDTQIAWTMIYGDITEKHSVQTITVSYTNDAGTVLTATFTVNVTQGA